MEKAVAKAIIDAVVIGVAEVVVEAASQPRKFTSDEIKKYIEEAEESYEDEFKIAPPWMMEVKRARLPPPSQPMSRQASGSLGGQAKAANAKKRGSVSW